MDPEPHTTPAPHVPQRGKPAESGGRTATQQLRVSWWPTSRPIPYARNPRRAPEAAVAKVAASLAEFGWRQPIVVDEAGVVVAGHTRLLAAKRLGLKKVPVHVAAELTPAQVKAYRLADNRTSEETSWDTELLPLEVAELAESGYELELLAFDARELAALTALPAAGLADPEAAPSPPEEPVTKRGDLWQLGPHRLLCGDAAEAEDVRRLMAGRRAALMATDPPYLVGYGGGEHPPTAGNGGKAGRSHEKAWPAYLDGAPEGGLHERFLGVACEHALAAAPAVYQFFGVTRIECVLAAWRAAGLLPHQVLIWRKSRAVLTYADYLWDYEPLLYGWKQGRRPALRPPNDARAVWEIASLIEDGAARVHPTQKPLECLRRPIAYHTTPGELLYEPFAGSGTALLAAEQLSRVCYALELAPAFCDVVVARWERLTGGKAVRRG